MKCVFALLSILVISSIARGQEAGSPNLAQMARDAAGKFRPATEQDVDATRRELNVALSRLDALLKNSRPEYDAGWRKYLRWDELTQQAQRPEGVDPRLADAVVGKMLAFEKGLAMPQFVGVRRALAAHADAVAAAGDEKQEESYKQQLEALAASLEKYEQDRSPEEGLAIARTVGWLSRRGQAPQLVAAVQRRFDQPNVHATISERFLAAVIEDDVDQTQGVTDNILGTQIYGTARTTGRTSIDLVPNDRSAQLDILLNGTAISNNVGYNGPVTIHSTGATSISGRKVLAMNEDGLYGYPANASCATSTNIYSISSCCRLIENLAWNRAAQQKGQAEAIASSHAASRVAGQMDAQAADLIADTNRRYASEVRNPLSSRDAFPQRMEFRSTSDRVEIAALQLGATGLGASELLPDLPAGGHDITVRAHESAVVNFGEALLGGVTLTDERLEKIIRDDLKAEVPEELQITPDKDPWSITFASESPVRAVFSGGNVTISIRGRRFTRGDQAISEPIEILASYVIEKTPSGTKLTRQGEVDVKFLERERLGAQQIAFKTFMTRKFEALFKPEFVSEGVVLKGRLARAGRLQVQEINSDQGWLAIGWQLAQPSPPAQPATTQAVATAD